MPTHIRRLSLTHTHKHARTLKLRHTFLSSERGMHAKADVPYQRGRSKEQRRGGERGREW